MTNQNMSDRQIVYNPETATASVVLPRQVLKSAYEGTSGKSVASLRLPTHFGLADNRIIYMPFIGRLEIDGKPHDIGGNTSRLLGMFALQPNCLITHDFIRTMIGDPEATRQDAYILVSLMRNLLPDDLADPQQGVIRNVHRRGYVGLSHIPPN